jgi:hypothetical protein
LASTIKVTNIDTPDGTGNITVDRPLSGSGASLTALNATQLTSGTLPIARIADDAITLAKMAPGTDGNIISYDASGNPVAIATGNDGQVLTSTGAGSPPAFETISAGVDGITSSADATAITIDSSERVGIGTASPSSICHLKTTGSTDVNLVFEGPNSTWCLGSDYSDGGKLKFSNNAAVGSSTTMTFGATNSVGIGTTAPTYTLDVEKWNDSMYLVEFQNLGSTNPNVLQLKYQYSLDGHHARFLNCTASTGVRCVIYGDGDIENHDNSYGGTSDEKLKQDISDSSSQWEDVKALGKIVRKFRFKTDVEADPDASYRLGLVAQEVEGISPALVKDTPDTEEVEIPSLDDEGNPEVDGEGNPIMETIHQETGTTTKAVKYSIAYMKAFKALGEAIERIEVLEQEVATLKEN